MLSVFFISIGLFVSLCRGFVVKGSYECSDWKDCISCARVNILSNNCRWCLRDKKCHSADSALNPCSKSENIVGKDDCSSPKYDPSLAYKMVFLSALSYADNVASYIAKATAVDSFLLTKQVTKPCSGVAANCSGFAAVSHTERAIAIAFRGSQNSVQIIDEVLRVLTEPKVSFEAGGEVQAYFNDAFVLIWDELETEVYDLITKYPSYTVWLTGHSLGAALASIASAVIAYDGKVAKNDLVLYTFGQPRVGDYEYAIAHDNLVGISFRITHYRDPVVHLPFCHTLAPATPCLNYTDGPYHHGTEIFYSSDMSQGSRYKTCNGLPHDEDLLCSNNVFIWAQCFLPTDIDRCIEDHRIYFGINVGKWWKTEKNVDVYI